MDAPALGHGEAILDLPRVARAVHAGGLLAVEVGRVESLLADPLRCGAVVVSTPDELAVEETREMWPRVARILGAVAIGAGVLLIARAAGLG